LNLEVGRFYGDGAKYKSVWDRMNIINKNAKLLTKAVEAGLDPFKVELIDATSKAQGNKGNIFHHFLLFTPSTVPFLHFCCFTIYDFVIDFVDICQTSLLGSAVTVQPLLSRIDSAASRETLS
jgi:hypothetical protein